MKKRIVPYNELEEKVALALTRVSTSRQEYQGSSLETQEDEIVRYAESHGIRIKRFFGKKHESANTPGEIFRDAVTAAISDPEINVLLVHTISRFSRNTEGVVARQVLKENGVYLISVTQPSNPDTPEGELLTDMNLLLAKYNNAIRRGHVIAGQRGQLKRGEWAYQIPFGYKRNPEKKKEILIDEIKGNLIKQAFKWRAEGIAQVTICERMQAQGVNMKPKRLSRLLRNPFYCGWLINRKINNVPKRGVHPALIDEETFFAINKEMRAKIYGAPTEWDYSDEIGKNKDRLTKLTPEYPLKRLIHCPHCGKLLTGYVTKRLAHVHHYYKCSTKGCGLNIKADDLHQQFGLHINHYQLNPKFIPLLKNVIRNEVRTRLSEDISNLPFLRKQHSELEKQKTNAEVNYAIGKISDSTYQVAMSRISDRIKTLDEQIYTAEQAERQSVDMMEYAIEGGNQVGKLIGEANYYDRLRLQSLIFPEGLEITSSIEELNAKKVCPIFQRMACVA